MKKYLFVFLVSLTSFCNSYSQIGWSTLQSPTNKIIYSIDFANSFTGWAVGSNGLIIKTTNGGQNWNSQSIDSIHDYYGSYFLNANTGWVAGTLIGNPNGTVLKTINGGVNWASMYEGPSLEIFNSIFFANNNYGWVVGNNGVIYKTTDGGISWISQSSGTNFNLNGVHFADTSLGWIVENNNIKSLNTGRILKTTNGGTNWFDVSPSAINGLRSIYFIDSLKGWVVGDGGTILNTTDGGNNWNLKISGTILDLHSLHFPNSQTGWVVGNLGTILKTTNGGSNWTPQFSNPLQNLYSVHFDNQLVGWTAGTNGTILKTISGGQNFIPSVFNSTRNINKPITNGQAVYDTISIPFSGLNYVNYLHFGVDTIINTPDSSLILILYHEGIYDTLIYHAGGVGSNFIGTVFNDSASTLITNGTPPFTGQFRPYRPLSQFNNTQLGGVWIFITIANYVNPPRTGVIKSWSLVISYNNLIKIKKIETNIPNLFKLEQNYPNPFNPSTTIKFSISEYGKFKSGNSNVILKVYNILGMEVATLVNEKLQSGNYEVQFFNNQLPSGIYFYILETQSYRETKKMLLIK